MSRKYHVATHSKKSHCHSQANEVGRMRHQLADQQRRERQLQDQLETSHRQLKETGTRLKRQAAAIRGGYECHEFRRPGLGRGKKASKKDIHDSSPYTLPSIRNTNKKKTQRKSVRYLHVSAEFLIELLSVGLCMIYLTRPTQGESYVSLPVLPHPAQLHVQSNAEELLHRQTIIQRAKTRAMTEMKPTSLPAFTFSKNELHSLACFRDPEIAQQVLEWLEMQGRLSDT